MSDKEDDSVTDEKNPCGDGMWRKSGSKGVIAQHLLDNTIGHWQEFPKNQNYAGYGYNLKSTKHKKLRKALKAYISKEIQE